MTDQPTPADLPGSFLRSPHGKVFEPPARYACPCGTNLHYAPVMADHLRNCSVFRNDVTTRLCPRATGSGTTHHLIPQRVGEMRGSSVFEHVCRDCGQKAAALRSDSAIEAAIAAIMEGSQS